MALIVSLRDGVRGRDGVKPGQKRQQQKTFIANFCDDFKQRNHKGLYIEEKNSICLQNGGRVDKIIPWIKHCSLDN